MRVLVQGLWHLGSVTAACLARTGHQVIGLDRDTATIATLKAGKAPISEPGLDDLLRAHPIEFTSDVAAAARADVAWVTYDTPVNADDVADVDFVVNEVAAMLPHLRAGAVVLVSSQLPVGSVARLEALRASVHFACSPENLRLGKAISVFSDPDRVILGVRDDHTKQVLTELFAPITAKLEWMSVESAEMTKHAINAFLALSVTFANELASVCERVGADAKEVERGLKTESRIGPKAYLGPGGAFAGGTLARDIAFLTAMGAERGLTLPLISGVRPSNEAHKKWARRRLEDRLGSLAGKSVSVLGLTYKAGTDTLRRSASVELCRDLADAGAKVRAFDPAVKTLPPELSFMELAPSAAAAIDNADALVIATEWPEFTSLDLAALTATMKRTLVVDANRFLAKQLAPITEYYAVGVPDRG